MKADQPLQRGGELIFALDSLETNGEIPLEVPKPPLQVVAMRGAQASQVRVPRVSDEGDERAHIDARLADGPALRLQALRQPPGLCARSELSQLEQRACGPQVLG